MWTNNLMLERHPFTNWLRSALSRWLRFINLEKGGIRFSWAEFYWRHLGCALSLNNNHSNSDWSLHLHLLWFNLYLRLPLPPREPIDGMIDIWGFKVYYSSLHLNWGARTRVIDLPWCWWQYDPAHTVWGLRGWKPYQFLTVVDNESVWPDKRIVWKEPFRYVNRSGESQQCTASFHVERSEYRWKALLALPFPRKRFQTLHVTFSEGLGEDRLSWKGGTTGITEEMCLYEKPLDTLRRMERELAGKL